MTRSRIVVAKVFLCAAFLLAVCAFPQIDESDSGGFAGDMYEGPVDTSGDEESFFARPELEEDQGNDEETEEGDAHLPLEVGPESGEEPGAQSVERLVLGEIPEPDIPEGINQTLNDQHGGYTEYRIDTANSVEIGIVIDDNGAPRRIVFWKEETTTSGDGAPVITTTTEFELCQIEQADSSFHIFSKRKEQNVTETLDGLRLSSITLRFFEFRTLLDYYNNGLTHINPGTDNPWWHRHEELMVGNIPVESVSNRLIDESTKTHMFQNGVLKQIVYSGPCGSDATLYEQKRAYFESLLTPY
jgi:hypothetical protein